MLCIFIDALNAEYLKHMPFLKSLTKSSLHGSLEVPLGYTSIIASFMTGMQPDKHGVFDLFVLDNKSKPKIKNPYLLAAIRLLQNKRMFYTPLQIKEASYFKPSMEKTWPQKNCLPCPTIFDILEKNHKSFEVVDWPNHFKNRSARIFFSKSSNTALQLTKKSKADFIFVHFLDLEIAHKFGIEARETIDAAKRIDDAVKQLYKKYEKERNILLFSDHGMNDIKKEINILSKIKNLNLRFGEDMVYLVGSTTVEFWFKNAEAKNKVIKLLKEIKEGRIINTSQFKLPKTSDLLFLADFQTAFYPNFFSKEHFKAMHGWNPKEQKTCYILKNLKKKGKKDARMIDFLPTILKIMNLPSIKCDGKSLLP